MKYLICTLLKLYKFKKSNTLRNLIKKIIGNRKIIIKFNNFYIYCGVNSAIESKLIFNEYDETKILALIDYFSKENYSFFDIGANIGIHSLQASSINPNINIYSFEPESKNFLQFINNINLNNFMNISPFKMGVSNSNEVLSINIHDGWNKGKHSFRANVNKSKHKYRVPVIKPDSIIQCFEVDRIMIKIDVEGFEFEAISGMKKLLQINDEVILFVELISEFNGLDSCKSIVNFLIEECGFKKIYIINENNTIKEVNIFSSDSDYILIKGTNTIDLFNNYNRN